MKENMIPDGDWVEISGDDWEEQELEDGTQFEYVLKVRDINKGLTSYYAILEEA